MMVVSMYMCDILLLKSVCLKNGNLVCSTFSGVLSHRVLFVGILCTVYIGLRWSAGENLNKHRILALVNQCSENRSFDPTA